MKCMSLFKHCHFVIVFTILGDALDAFDLKFVCKLFSSRIFFKGPLGWSNTLIYSL